MKHEFKPGDTVMVEGIYVEGFEFNVLIEAKYLKVNIDRIHPIPTPPRPLRVDELVKDSEYTFRSCADTLKGKFTGLILGVNAIMEVDDDLLGLRGVNVVESQNIRPVERVVSDEEIIKKWNEILLSFNRATVVDEEVIKLVRHFMKGGSQ